MVALEDYVARIEETCGDEKNFIVIFKYDKKDKVIAKILKKAKKEKAISTIIFELTYENVSFRLYGTGKAIFRGLKNKEELKNFLSNLIL
jgi:ribonuclease HIII